MGHGRLVRVPLDGKVYRCHKGIRLKSVLGELSDYFDSETF